MGALPSEGITKVGRSIFLYGAIAVALKTYAVKITKISALDVEVSADKTIDLPGMLGLLVLFLLMIFICRVLNEFSSDRLLSLRTTQSEIAAANGPPFIGGAVSKDANKQPHQIRIQTAINYYTQLKDYSQKGHVLFDVLFPIIFGLIVVLNLRPDICAFLGNLFAGK